jgi:hypothetical protein
MEIKESSDDEIDTPEDQSNQEEHINLMGREGVTIIKTFKQYKFRVVIAILLGLLLLWAVYLFVRPHKSLYYFPGDFYPDNGKALVVSNRSLQSACQSTTWRKNLYLNCTSEAKNEFGIRVSAQMGATNLKAMIMSCVRFAIDAGMNLYIPRVPIRLESDPAQFNLWTDLTYLIDVEYLKKQLQAECPQLGLYDVHLDIPNGIMKPRANVIPPPSVGKGEYRSKIDEVLMSKNIDLNTSVPTVIYDNEAMFGWKFNTEPVIRQFLRKAVKYQDNLTSVGRRISNLINEDYIGFHLRVEHGWWHEDYVELTQTFLQTIKKNVPNIKTIYVAVGDINIENQFRTDMAKLGLSVVSKWQIAFKNQDVLDELSALTFDQRAVVDQEILERSVFFYGNGYSSLAYAIAQNRGDGNIDDCQCYLVYGLYYAFKCCY